MGERDVIFTTLAVVSQGADERDDHIGDLLSGLVFPESKDCPSFVLELLDGAYVSLLVLG